VSSLRRNANACAAAVITLAAGTASGQNDDVPLPPRIDAEPSAAESSMRAPVRTRLAPLPDDRPMQDEIVVIGRSQFRLPDLGSSWRAEQEAAREAAARIRVTFLPLYDPEAEPLANDLFLVNREAQRRHGVIELFRLRFGRRGRD
jgi:hypothetical protein